jgi:arginine-tRNA-protein transferase
MHNELLHAYLTAPYPCSYLPEQQARSEVAIPIQPVSDAVYQQLYVGLMREGFRRSGPYVYRPRCDACQACTSLRVRTHDFKPDRSQRRSAARHADLVVRVRPVGFDAEHFALYQRYQSHRHVGGGMDQDSAKQYAESMLPSRVHTRIIEFREPDLGPNEELGQLRIVSLVDVLDDGLSAVYTFFDPDVVGASYGTYAVLWQIERARRLGLPYVYLGYWIEGCRKMNYKTRFVPHEVLIAGRWQASKPPLPAKRAAAASKAQADPVAPADAAYKNSAANDPSAPEAATRPATHQAHHPKRPSTGA